MLPRICLKYLINSSTFENRKVGQFEAVDFYKEKFHLPCCTKINLKKKKLIINT